MDRIGRYRIDGKIGQGGTSHVYKGWDATLGRHVAVKTISADVGDDPTLKKRFEREAQSAAKLNHPHIITVYDFGQEGDKLYLAMELLEGEDLKQAITAGRLADLDAKLEAMSQICDGLAFIHANGIVHRDLKPANIHLLPDGQLKIMDFGLARSSGSDMTRTGLVMGTPHYMSPEQVRGEHVDFRCDVFALGCVFYEILTGKKPFDADSIHSVLYKVMQEEPRPARQLVPGLPRVLEQILERAMAKAPGERFAHAGEMGEFLERAREAIASGRGDEPLAGVAAVAASAAPAPAPGASRSPEPPGPTAGPPAGPPRAEGARAPAVSGRRSERSGSGVSSGSRPRSRPPGATGPSRTLAFTLGGGALLLLLGGGFLAFRSAGRGSSVADDNAAKVSAMMQDLARKRALLARARLDAGDYEDALEKAGEALKYDAGQAEAKAVAEEARRIKARVAKAVADSRPGSGPASDAARAAFWDLLQVAPGRNEARDFAAAYESFLQPQAEEARGLMDAARKSAAAARAGELDEFKSAGRLGGEADAAYKAGRFASAARDYLRARDLLRRAEGLAGGASPR